MVWNQKIAYRIFLVILIIVFISIFYFVFISKDNGAEKLLQAVGFESSENKQDAPAVPLPSGTIGGSSGAGSGSGSSGGSGGSEEIDPVSLKFCTFDAFHTITSNVPCRCGFSSVCYEEESVCDATFNNGEGYCS
jgi:hypothetical protein